MSNGNGSTYTCKNHQDLRWFDTKPGGKLVFIGQVFPDASVKPAHPMCPIPPMTYLRARMDGKNPFDTRLESEPIKDWAELVELVDSYKDMMEKYVFECECPGSDLEKVDEDANDLIRRRELNL